MTKGFITLATGSERYFELALNLLKSYRLTTKDPLPFAILTDRHNKYTSEFDQVIILENARSSYMDKLAVMINCPFDETIFIDADCLAYGDLNQYWDLYDFRYPITCFGFSGPLNYQEGWFKISDIGEYRHSIKFIPSLHGGVLFIKRSEVCNKMYRLAMEINKDYRKYKFKYFQQPADEPILALCMAIFDSPPIPEISGREMIFYPTVKKFKADFLLLTNSCVKGGKLIDNSLLVHWQNNVTQRAIYKVEIAKINLLWERKSEPLKNKKIKSDYTPVSNKDLIILKVLSLIYQGRDFVYFTTIKIKVRIYRLLNGNRKGKTV